MDKLVNVTCESCSRPLFAFRQKNGTGPTFMESTGAGIRIDPATPATVYAQCPACKAETPFARSLLP